MFDINAWRKQIADGLGHLPTWQKVGANTLFSFLCSMTLFPLVEVASKGDTLSMGMTLGAITGGIGSNLIAEVVKRWQDRYSGDVTDVAQASLEVERLIAKSNEFRQALDTILDRLEVLSIAQTSLLESGENIALERLFSELADLFAQGYFPQVRHSMIATGDVSGKGIAIGEQASAVVIEGDVVKEKYDLHVDSPIGFEKSLRSYLVDLSHSCSRLPLASLAKPASATGVGQPQLGNIYIHLYTTTRLSKAETFDSRPVEVDPSRPPRRDAGPLTVLSAVRWNPKVVISGEPGAGKSTFVNYLVLRLAQRILSDGILAPDLPGWQADLNPIPVRVLLRDLCSTNGSRTVAPKIIWDHIVSFLVQRKQDAFIPFLEKLLHEGQLLVLFDGLDEVSAPVERQAVRDNVLAFAETFPLNRYLVTCRVLSYQDPRWKLPDFPEYIVAPLVDEQIFHFAGLWYRELARIGQIRQEDIETYCDQFRVSVKRPAMSPLASNPMLLTMMAQLHAHRGRFPESRARLYKEAVEILLWRWDAVKYGEKVEPGLTQKLGNEIRQIDIQAAMWHLAYRSFADEREEGQVSTALLHEVLPKYIGDDWGRWQTFIQHIQDRSGLLLERAPGVFVFPHRTIQEFLASQHLLTLPDLPSRASQLIYEDKKWYEVIRLAAGSLFHDRGETDRVVSLAEHLCPADRPADDRDWFLTWMAGEVLLEVGRHRLKENRVGRYLLERVRDLLLGLAVGGHLSPKERVRAALVLGELGDPRFTNFKFGRETRYIEPQLSHVIQPKTVLMKGIGRITQEAPYQIGLYPVTNAEYACFCEARGYERDEFWPAEGVGERNRRGWSQPAFWEDAVLGCPNFPVVGVSWYEAIAFCNWLSHVTGDCYRLPTEAEWQLAVQGIKSDLLYAWGEESPTDQCNWNRIVGSTSAVGIFPLDKGESGIFDVAGNVNEWTCDLYSKGGTMPAIRGGSWLDEEEKWLQCAYRDEYFPSGNFDHIGFRYVRILEGKEHRTAK